jgi:hypothetical protein
MALALMMHLGFISHVFRANANNGYSEDHGVFLESVVRRQTKSLKAERKPMRTLMNSVQHGRQSAPPNCKIIARPMKWTEPA